MIDQFATSKALASLEGPAAVIRDLQDEIQRLEHNLAGAKTREADALAEAERAIERMEVLEEEVKRTSPINPADERWLAGRSCKIEWSIRVSDGRPLAILSGRGFKTLMGRTAAEVLDAVQGRKPTARPVAKS